MVHPVDRMLQYWSRVEVVVEDMNANVHPKGISFTANNMALVYPLDDAGARSTSDMFHVLQASDVVNTLFSEVAKLSNWESGEVLGVEMLESAQYYGDNRFVAFFCLATALIFPLLAYPVVMLAYPVVRSN